MEKKQKIEVQGLPITIETIGENDYVSLTDLAKHRGSDAKDIIKSWLRNGSTLHFIEAWEELHNSKFKREQMFPFYKDATDSARRHLITTQRLAAETDAVGIVSKAGRNGGTWAHCDLALNFCYWFEPRFQLYFLKEFQRLKKKRGRTHVSNLGCRARQRPARRSQKLDGIGRTFATRR